jgi:hypothetical protein
MECLGLALAERGDGYRQLRADDLVLWLVRGQAPAPKLDRDGSVIRRSDVPLKFGFAVESIDRAALSIEGVGGTVAQKSWNLLAIGGETQLTPRATSSRLEPRAEPRRPVRRRSRCGRATRVSLLLPRKGTLGPDGFKTTAGRDRSRSVVGQELGAVWRMTLPHIPAEWECLVGRFLGRGHSPSCRWFPPWVREMQFPHPSRA